MDTGCASKRNLKDCPQKLKEIAYFSLVRSFVDYASAVWDPHQEFNQDKLEMVQRRAATFVKNRYKRTDSVIAMHAGQWRSEGNWRPGAKLNFTPPPLKKTLKDDIEMPIVFN